MKSLLVRLSAFVLFALSFPVAPAHSENLAPELLQSGPGGKIHGADISRWQHPMDKQINFSKMRQAGISFVMIKASDARDDADILARKYLTTDRSSAQAQGIYTGYYHYAVLPNVTTPSKVIEDAKTQAQKVIWRLASVGGYGAMDLPYALDLENNCVKLRSNKSCSKYATRSAVTLWAKTFLKVVKTKTGRTPIIYSYPSFLEKAMARDAELATYPLWLAQYAIDPAKEGAAPGVKPGGCFVHSWTTSACKSNWTIWQYTSCGIAPKYGVPGSRLDLNVFRGEPETFMQLLNGLWTPSVGDFMPENESSTMKIVSVFASTTDKNVVISVDVTRPDNSPVVTGTVKYVSDQPIIAKTKPVQTLLRSTSGSWKLSISDVPVGVYTGKVVFSDVSGTHAQSEQTITFEITQGATTKPSPKPTLKPKPNVDGCANQIKN